VITPFPIQPAHLGWYSILEPGDDDLITAISGTSHGVDWSIESSMGRRIGYRLTVAGIYLATLPTPAGAAALRDEYIDDMITQDRVGAAA
jgi:hypothetical protein